MFRPGEELVVEVLKLADANFRLVVAISKTFCAGGADERKLMALVDRGTAVLVQLDRTLDLIKDRDLVTAAQLLCYSKDEFAELEKEFTQLTGAVETTDVGAKLVKEIEAMKAPTCELLDDIAKLANSPAHRATLVGIRARGKEAGIMFVKALALIGCDTTVATDLVARAKRIFAEIRCELDVMQGGPEPDPESVHK